MLLRLWVADFFSQKTKTLGKGDILLLQQCHTEPYYEPDCWQMTTRCDGLCPTIMRDVKNAIVL
jgi:hypothetical protein